MVPEEKRDRNGQRTNLKMIDKNFPDLEKETDSQVQEAQRVPNKINPKRPTPRHIIIKMVKIKDKRILKAAREK